MTDWKKRIQEEMVVSRKEVNEKLLQLAAQYARFSEDGDIHFIVDVGQLPRTDQFALYLVSKWFAHEGGLVDTENVTSEELIDCFQASRGTVQGRLSDMVSNGLVQRVNRGEYRVRYVKMDGILNRIKEKLVK